MKRNYLSQQARNVSKLKDTEYTSKLDALKKITEILNSNGIEFAISFSGNLFFTGIVTTFNDIDVAIHFNGNIAKFKEILICNGISINYEKLDGKGVFFPTNLFLNCAFDGVQIEIYNVDFSVNKFHFVKLDGQVIPLMPIELMFVQYSILEEFQPEKRRKKRILIEEYLENTGITNCEFLEDAIEDVTVSLWIRIKCQQFLDQKQKRE